MSRLSRCTALAVVLIAGLTPVAPAGAAPAPGPLGSHLRLKGFVWGLDGGDPAVGAIGVGAPRSWTLSVSPRGRGTFVDPTGTFDETFDEAPGHRTVRGDQRRLVHLLGGAPGARVVDASEESDELFSSATVTFRYADSAGRSRLVSTRFVAYGQQPQPPSDFVLTVSGRPMDAPGLARLLERATARILLVG